MGKCGFHGAMKNGKRNAPEMAKQYDKRGLLQNSPLKITVYNKRLVFEGILLRKQPVFYYFQKLFV